MPVSSNPWQAEMQAARRFEHWAAYDCWLERMRVSKIRHGYYCKDAIEERRRMREHAAETRRLIQEAKELLRPGHPRG